MTGRHQGHNPGDAVAASFTPHMFRKLFRARPIVARLEEFKSPLAG